MPKTIPYCWSCHACREANAAGTNICVSCGFPAMASGAEIEKATCIQNYSPKNSKVGRDHVVNDSLTNVWRAMCREMRVIVGLSGDLMSFVLKESWLLSKLLNFLSGLVSGGRGIAILLFAVALYAIWVAPGLNAPEISASDSHSLYFFSTIAQTLAAVIAVIFAIILVVVQFSALGSIGEVTRILGGWVRWYFVLFIIAILHSTWQLTLSKFDTYHTDKWAYSLYAACLIGMIPFFSSFMRRLSPAWMIQHLRRDGIRSLTKNFREIPAQVGALHTLSERLRVLSDHESQKLVIEALVAITAEAATLQFVRLSEMLTLCEPESYWSTTENHVANVLTQIVDSANADFIESTLVETCESNPALFKSVCRLFEEFATIAASRSKLAPINNLVRSLYNLGKHLIDNMEFPKQIKVEEHDDSLNAQLFDDEKDPAQGIADGPVVLANLALLQIQAFPEDNNALEAVNNCYVLGADALNILGDRGAIVATSAVNSLFKIVSATKEGDVAIEALEYLLLLGIDFESKDQFLASIVAKNVNLIRTRFSKLYDSVIDKLPSGQYGTGENGERLAAFLARLDAIRD